VLEEEGEAEDAEGLGDEEEVGSSAKMVGIRERGELGSSEEGVSEDSFENLEGKGFNEETKKRRKEKEGGQRVWELSLTFSLFSGPFQLVCRD